MLLLHLWFIRLIDRTNNFKRCRELQNPKEENHNLLLLIIMVLFYQAARKNVSPGWVSGLSRNSYSGYMAKFLQLKRFAVSERGKPYPAH